MILLLELWLKIIEDADYDTAINLSSIYRTIYLASNKIREYHFKKRMEILCNRPVSINTMILGIYTHLSKDELLGSYITVYDNFWSGSAKLYFTPILLTETNIIDCDNMRKIIINKYCCHLKLKIKNKDYNINIRLDNDKIKGKSKLVYNFNINEYNTFYTDNFVAYGEKIKITKLII